MKKLLLLLLLICLTVHANVEFLNNNNFNNKISKGIVVVEYWAEWNKSNELDEKDQCRNQQRGKMKNYFLNLLTSYYKYWLIYYVFPS